MIICLEWSNSNLFFFIHSFLQDIAVTAVGSYYTSTYFFINHNSHKNTLTFPELFVCVTLKMSYIWSFTFTAITRMFSIIMNRYFLYFHICQLCSCIVQIKQKYFIHSWTDSSCLLILPWLLQQNHIFGIQNNNSVKRFYNRQLHHPALKW